MAVPSIWVVSLLEGHYWSHLRMAGAEGHEAKAYY